MNTTSTTTIDSQFHNITNNAGYVNPYRVISNGNKAVMMKGIRENLVSAYDSLTSDSEALESSAELMGCLNRVIDSISLLNGYGKTGETQLVELSAYTYDAVKAIEKVPFLDRPMVAFNAVKMNLVAIDEWLAGNSMCAAACSFTIQREFENGRTV